MAKRKTKTKKLMKSGNNKSVSKVTDLPAPSSVLERYELTNTDKEVFKWKVQFPKMDSKEVGEIVGIHANTVRSIWIKPAFVQALDEYHMLDLDRIGHMRQDATRTYHNLLKTGSESTKEKVARTILQAPGGVLYDNKKQEQSSGGMIIVELPDGSRTAYGDQKLISEIKDVTND